MIGKRFDVVVVGAGAVGLAGALAFARSGLVTCLVGPAPDRRDGRTAALLEGSLAFLRSLGLGTALEGASAPLATLRIIDDTGSLFRPPPVEFRAAEIGLAAFGRNIENATLVGLLAASARSAEGLTWREDKAGGLAGEAFDRVRLAGSDVLEGALVVAADGRMSSLRAEAGLRATERRYPQSALTTILRHEREHRDASTEFHTRSGPFTLVPLPGRRSSLVWVERPEEAERLVGLDDPALARAVERRSRSILGGVQIDGPRGLVPIGTLSVDRLFARSLALVGEAAHALPPIGAQGLNLGLADVAALAHILTTERVAGEALSAHRVLPRYERARLRDVQARTFAVDGLNRALLSTFAPLAAARGIGLGALARIGPLRRAVMRAGLMADRNGGLRTGRG